MGYESDRGVGNVFHRDSIGERLLQAAEAGTISIKGDSSEATEPTINALISRDDLADTRLVYAAFDFGTLVIRGEYGHAPLRNPDEGDYALRHTNPSHSNSGGAVILQA